MPPKFLVDLDEIDLNRVEIAIDEIRKANPQRHEMEQLSGIIKYAPREGYIVGFKDIGKNEFWIRGHIPGRPLMPGVIMCEAAAQLCSFYYSHEMPAGADRFVGFGGMNDVKFRGTVVPGDRFIVIAKNIELKSRRAVFQTQGIVNGRLVFEAVITGMPL